jgi:hypothetical protein
MRQVRIEMKVVPPAMQRGLGSKKKGPPATRQPRWLDRVTLRSTEDTPMTVSMKRVLVGLHQPANAAALVVYASSIIERMTNNRWFSEPVPSLARVRSATKALDDAETKALTLARGLKEKRNRARAALVSLLKQLKAYVETVANDNPDNAVSVIESSGMHVVTPTHPVKAPFAVRHGKVSGQVRLDLKADHKGSSYNWQMSTDGGETWIDLPKTAQAHTLVSGLVPGKTYWFRARILTRRGLGDWTDKLSIIVQ